VPKVQRDHAEVIVTRITGAKSRELS